MPNASKTLLPLKRGIVATVPQRSGNWLLLRVIGDLAVKGEHRWSVIEAEYFRRLQAIARAA